MSIITSTSSQRSIYWKAENELQTLFEIAEKGDWDHIYEKVSRNPRLINECIEGKTLLWIAFSHLIPSKHKQNDIWHYAYHQEAGNAIDFIEKIINLKCALDLDATPLSAKGQSVLFSAFFSVFSALPLPVEGNEIDLTEDPHREKKWEILQKLVENCSDCNPNVVHYHSLASCIWAYENSGRSWPLLMQLIEKTSQKEISIDFPSAVLVIFLILL